MLEKAQQMWRAGRHSVNISRQKHVQRKETLLFWCLIFSGQISCFGCRNEGRASDTHTYTHTHTHARTASFSSTVTSLPKFRGKKPSGETVCVSPPHIGAGINSDACHVWNIVGLHWKLRKMDGTIKVRAEERDLSEMDRVWELVVWDFSAAPSLCFSSSLSLPLPLSLQVSFSFSSKLCWKLKTVAEDTSVRSRALGRSWKRTGCLWWSKDVSPRKKRKKSCLSFVLKIRIANARCSTRLLWVFSVLWRARACVRMQCSGLYKS